MPQRFKYVRFFNELGIGDVAHVGGKNASLGEMYRELRTLLRSRANPLLAGLLA